MFGKMDPKQMASMMKQFGIKSEEIDAGKVIVELKDGGKLVVENPSVQAIDFQGQKMLQVSGKLREEKGAEGGAEEKEKSDSDIIMEECGCSLEDAEKALAEANGDLAEAILSLKK